MAIARAHFAARFNRPGFDVIDHSVFVLCGDGCLQEGISGEASSLAGHLGLGSIVLLYDDNQITIDGTTDLSFSEDVGKRYEAYGWHVQTVEDGNDDLGSIHAAIERARAETARPSIIKVRTSIGRGAVGKEGTHGVHGAPLGEEILAKTKAALGCPADEKFRVSETVRGRYAAARVACEQRHTAWSAMLARYAQAHPDAYAEFARRLCAPTTDGKGSLSHALPAGFSGAASLPKWKVGDKAAATRATGGKVLSSLAEQIPDILCGSADLTPSNKTMNPHWGGDFQRKTPGGRYLRFGVREHAMAAVCNGLHAYGGVVPACATFLNFIEYAFPAVRLSALGRMRVLYIMTHDSVGLGEDGPTHQPVEALALCRATPNLLTFRPCDGNEVAGAYAAALATENCGTPSVFALSRQGCPVLPGTSADAVTRGAYVVDAEAPTLAGAPPALTMVATGSEVATCVEAKKLLLASGFGGGVRVVSMPCWKLFERQTEEYKRSVFAAGSPTVAVEAAAAQGWEAYSHAQVCMRRFGASGPGKAVMAKFGFTAEKIAASGRKASEFFGAGRAHDLMRRLDL
jgi:transketolase